MTGRTAKQVVKAVRGSSGTIAEVPWLVHMREVSAPLHRLSTIHHTPAACRPDFWSTKSLSRRFLPHSVRDKRTVAEVEAERAERARYMSGMQRKRRCGVRAVA